MVKVDDLVKTIVLDLKTIYRACHIHALMQTILARRHRNIRLP